MLNGCSTAGQVEALHAAGVPLMVASSAPVGNEVAAQFSTRLLQALETGLSIGEAFEQAIGEAQAEIRASTPDAPLWGLKPHPDKPDATGWKLPIQAARPANLRHEPNELLLETLYDTFAQTNPRVRELHKAGALLDERKEGNRSGPAQSPSSTHQRACAQTRGALKTRRYRQLEIKKPQQGAGCCGVRIIFQVSSLSLRT